jgi:hypothetical protein
MKRGLFVYETLDRIVLVQKYLGMHFTPKGFYILAQGQRSATLGKKASLTFPPSPVTKGGGRGGG